MLDSNEHIELDTRSNTMFGILFWVEAEPGKLQEFKDHAQWCVDVAKEKEPDTLRFDWYTDPENENALYVYEAYTDEAGFEAHKQNEPYQAWSQGTLRLFVLVIQSPLLVNKLCFLDCFTRIIPRIRRGDVSIILPAYVCHVRVFHL